MARAGDGGSLFVEVDDFDDLDIIEISDPNRPTRIASLLNPTRPQSSSASVSSRRSDRSRESRWEQQPRRSARWERPPPPPPPRSQTTTTVIDLTDEPDSPVMERRPPPAPPAVPGRNPRRTNSQRPSPPRLARSDSTFVGPGAVIDLTGDSPRENRRLESAHQLRVRHPHPPGRQHLPRPVPSDHDHLIELELMSTPNLLTTFRTGVRHVVDTLFNAELLRSGYQPTFESLGTFSPREPSPKPPMEEVPPTRSGFTRDTCGNTEDTEERVVVCPACNEELAYDPTQPATQGSTATAGRKRKRAPGEHHFWALKKCGHVYCADCFEGRKPTKASPHGVGFRGQGARLPTSAPHDLKCAVGGCETKVTAKTEWIGIFL